MTLEELMQDARDFKRFLLTNKGVLLLSKLQTGSMLEITRVSVGDGQINLEETSINELNDLVHYLCNTKIISNRNNSNGTSTLKVELTNEGREQAIFIREIGIFANDPDEGEILYGYSFTEVPVCLPIFSGYEVAKIQWDLVTGIGNADNVNVEIRKVEVDYDEFNNYLEKIKKNWEAQMEAINRNFDAMNNMFQMMNSQYMEKFNQDITVINTTIDGISANIEGINTVINMVTNQIATLTGNMSQMQNQLQTDLNSKADKNHTHDFNEFINLTEFTEFKNEFTEFKGEYEEFKGGYTELKDDYDELKNEYTELKQEVEKTVVNNNNLLVEVAVLKGEIPVGYADKMLIESFRDISLINLESGFYDHDLKVIKI